jgi:short-subunit dehydrogenase
MRIEGKVVLITGASEGIGAACAAEFARAGAKLSLTARNAAALAKAGGPEALTVPGDLTDDAVRRQAVESTVARFGGIDILINNAGLGSYQPSWNIPMDEARYLMELNFFSVLALSQLVTPHMRARGGGMIVNVGSIGGKVVLPWLTVYSASKYALGALTEGMRMELRKQNISTMLVCPGYVKTGFQQHALAGKAPRPIERGRKFAITAAQCATAIRRGVERDARTVVTPASGWILVALARLFPGLVQSRMAEMNV